MRMNLQLFAAEAVAGKKIVYLYRVMGSKKAGANLAFVTENGKTVSKDADSTATKDGSIRTPSAAEIEITSTSILSKGDATIDELEAALHSDTLIEIWEANLEEKALTGTNKFKGKYYQGYLTEMEITSNAEDMAEVSLTFGINGKGASGDVTVTTEQQELAMYAFKDSTATT